PFLASNRADIAAMKARLKLPAVEFADAGGLMSYGYSLPDIYRQSARLVDKILKGAKPGELPFELPTRYELIVNLKTAKAMGLNILDSFLLLADEIIECNAEFLPLWFAVAQDVIGSSALSCSSAPWTARRRASRFRPICGRTGGWCPSSRWT